MESEISNIIFKEVSEGECESDREVLRLIDSFKRKCFVSKRKDENKFRILKSFSERERVREKWRRLERNKLLKILSDLRETYRISKLSDKRGRGND